MAKRSLASLSADELRGKRVLVRVDFNVPLNDAGAITDDTRIRAALPTINDLTGKGARVILSAHFGRPKGQVNEAMRLTPVAARLSELLGKSVVKTDSCIGPDAEAKVAAMADGDVVLLENVRFFAEEEKNEGDFAKQLASLAQVYVNDAFGAAHRAHASTEGVTKFLSPSVAGHLMEKELAYLQGAIDAPKRPLAERLRPKSLDDFAGQEHILGKGKPLRRAIESDHLSSLILWGPPGVGKTSLATIIAQTTKAEFVPFSAVLSGMKEIKEVMARAEQTRRMGRRTVLFVDEIHRFNKAQQDAFLPYVEKGDVILIGATTENPSFEVNSALLSRSRVYALKALDTKDLVVLLTKGLEELHATCDPAHLEQLAIFANGDARSAYNLLELAASSADNGEITQETLGEIITRKSLLRSEERRVGKECRSRWSPYH